jgi:XRE family transcriptional regulator, regulator of sulfur utilization
MNISRRDLKFLLPVLAGMKAGAQQQGAGATLPSKVYKHEAIPYRAEHERKKGRRFFAGGNRDGFGLEMHETILAPGTETHAPHKHLHEEVVIVVEGSVEAFVDGTTEKAEAGSVIYFASNQMHNARNAGTVNCRYYVIELRGQEKRNG